MEAFQERMVSEYKELKDRVEKLEKFNNEKNIISL